ncbi:hypothetical protein VSVS05_00410 [Vibrio scophthalmi]|uniref:Uncharacterized protein n=1 Tax=Vibrio scophthalmi TaxID=45658 RepID=A0A1C7F6X2_9VIBR|nr:hypothetical protein VSVS05_00410 [Vibrio scophthalmi]
MRYTKVVISESGVSLSVQFALSLPILFSASKMKSGCISTKWFLHQRNSINYRRRSVIKLDLHSRNSPQCSTKINSILQLNRPDRNSKLVERLNCLRKFFNSVDLHAFNTAFRHIGRGNYRAFKTVFKCFIETFLATWHRTNFSR